MGKPMTGHLADTGYPLSVYDVDPAQAEVVAAKHPQVQVMSSPKDVAAAADIVITMLPSGPYVRDAALGDNGLIHGFREGCILLDTSSCEPWITVETAGALAARGIGMVDAPVSGAQIGAINADLVFMVGGDKANVDRVLPVLKPMGNGGLDERPRRRVPTNFVHARAVPGHL